MTRIIPIVFLFFSSLMGLFSCSNQNANTNINTNNCENITQHQSIGLSKYLENHAKLIATQTGVYALEEGAEAMIARAWLCDQAEKTIDIQYFIFSADNIGLIACDYLVRAADRGVKIRILVDDIMVDADSDDLLLMQSHENISIKIYNPTANVGKGLSDKIFSLTTNFRGVNQRMHNKTFTVDDKAVITGGRNIADEYFDYDHEYNFRDRDILMIGKDVSKVLYSFNEFWNSDLSVSVNKLVKTEQENLSPNRFEQLHEYACDTGNFSPLVRAQINNFNETFNKIQNTTNFRWLDQITFVSDMPGKNDGSSGLSGSGRCTDSLIRLIRNAKYSIDIQSPYLVTTEVGQNLFADAVKRGVKVRILTNSLASTDNLEAFNGYQRDRSKLLDKGIKIYEFKPDAVVRLALLNRISTQNLEHTPIFGLHAKSMVIDKKITVIGTFNLDPRSANLNTECIAVVDDEPFAQRTLNYFEEDFKPENSWEVTPLFNPDSVAGKTKQIKAWTRGIVPKKIL